MKHRCNYYRTWMEWRDPRRYGVEYERALTHEVAEHLGRPLGPLSTLEDAARVKAEGEVSYAAAVARARTYMASVRRRLRRGARATGTKGKTRLKRVWKSERCPR